MTNAAPPATDQQPGTAMLLPVLEHTRADLGRADLTALAGPALLAAIAQGVTQLGTIPPAVRPCLMTAAVFATGVLIAACVAIWPRRINVTTTTPGSWLHARSAADTTTLLAAYRADSFEEITAEQLHELAAVAHRKWTAVRWMLAMLLGVVETLLIALMIGLAQA